MKRTNSYGNWRNRQTLFLRPALIFGQGLSRDGCVRGGASQTGIGQTLSLIGYIVVFLIAKIPVRLRMKKSWRGEKFATFKLYLLGSQRSLNMAIAFFYDNVPKLLILSAFAGSLMVLILGIYYKNADVSLFSMQLAYDSRDTPVGEYNLGANETTGFIVIFQSYRYF